MSVMRFALFGAGFWAGYQLAAWQEVPGAQCAVVCDPDLTKATALAARFGIAHVCSSPEEALKSENALDFVDICTPPKTHPELVRLALDHRLPVICQKPLAEHLSDAVALEKLAEALRIPLLVHENWRWQTPIRALKQVLESQVIGEVFRARLTMASSFDVFANQPNLQRLERFLLADIGVHVLDAARFLFGEARSVYAETRCVRSERIAGEDAATVLTKHRAISVVSELSYVLNPYERDHFPETFVFIEGTLGTIELAPDFWLRVTTKDGTQAKRVPPPRYAWADPAYDVVHASMVPCLTNLLSGVSGGTTETTAADNLKTLQLVEAAYESAASHQAVLLS
jgi:D-apiose dehydrogenase